MDTTTDIAPPLSDAEMWRAVEARSAAHDGRFVFAVRTTGIYCRPSCAARRPRRANVSFHASAEAAEAAGFRPCLRCRPREMAPDADITARIASACRHIEAAEQPPTLAELAARAGLSRHHFHRLFRSVTGVTAKAYADAVRAARVRERLPAARTITEAAHAAGYSGSARFYAAAGEVLGMSARSYRQGGAGLVVHYALGAASLGLVLVGATDTGISAILIGEDEADLVRDLRARFPRATIAAADATFSTLTQAAIAAVDMPQHAHQLPLDIRGTAFQQRVWQALRGVPCGTTISYGELAARIGAPKAVRAVARACGANPLAVVVPCHRVVGGDGALTGYRWGIDRKRALLDREAATKVAPPATTRARRDRKDG